MSLGARVRVDTPPSVIFEQVGQRALRAGTLIVAAAGNDSNRPFAIDPVSHPANCASIMAVAALDQQLQVARFSNAGLNPQGGQVDLAGPGVAVHSAWPRPDLHNRISGTSMATPHVAGIAALLAEANPAARAARRSGHSWSRPRAGCRLPRATSAPGSCRRPDPDRAPELQRLRSRGGHPWQPMLPMPGWRAILWSRQKDTGAARWPRSM